MEIIIKSIVASVIATSLINICSADQMPVSDIKASAVNKYKRDILSLTHDAQAAPKQYSSEVTNYIPKDKSHQIPKALLFVSFSISDSELKQYFIQSKKYQIPMIIRGLVNNSFKSTASKMFELTKKDNIGGVAIDPVWFEKFNVNQVPALVVLKAGANCELSKTCAKSDYDIVYGNVPIYKSLEIIRDKGKAASKEAGSILGGSKDA